MKLLVTGRGTSGSWQIRGKQLGEAIGAHIAPRASNFRGYSPIIVVKRLNDELLGALRQQKRKWIWDMVDCWPQSQFIPGMARGDAIHWLQQEIQDKRPDAIVFSTHRMLIDSHWAGPALVLPHHAWPKYTRSITVHPDIRFVGYEGSERYLGKWMMLLEEECTHRGWQFHMNQGLEGCDIGIALRDPLDYASQNWKSNCKLANMQVLGLPAICSPENGYLETSSQHEVFISNTEDLSGVFDLLTPQETRIKISEAMKMAAPHLDDIAKTYLEWLHRLNF